MDDKDIIRMINDNHNSDNESYANSKIPSYLEGNPRIVISEESDKNMKITFKSIDYPIMKGR